MIDADRLQYGIDKLALDLLNFRKIATEELIGKGKGQVSMDRVTLDLRAANAELDKYVGQRNALQKDRDLLLADYTRLQTRLNTLNPGAIIALSPVCQVVVILLLRYSAASP